MTDRPDTKRCTHIIFRRGSLRDGARWAFLLAVYLMSFRLESKPPLPSARLSGSSVAQVERKSSDHHSKKVIALEYIRRGDESIKTSLLQLAKAERDYRTAIQLDPENLQSHEKLADLYYSEQEWDKSIDEYAEALRLESNSEWLHVRLAYALRRKVASSNTDDVLLREEAIFECREAVRISPKSATSHLCLAEMLGEGKYLDEAIDEFRQVISLVPENATVLTELAQLLSDSGNKLGAVAEYRKAIYIQPNNPYLHQDLANALTHVDGQFDDALAEFREALKLKPDNAQFQRNVDDLTRRENSLDQGIEEQRNRVLMNPRDPAGHLRLASELREKGDFVSASAECQKVLTLDMADDSNAPYYTMMAYSERGAILQDEHDWEGAIAELKKALGVAPNNGELHSQLAQILEQRGDLRAALSEYGLAGVLGKAGYERLFYYLNFRQNPEAPSVNSGPGNPVPEMKVPH